MRYLYVHVYILFYICMQAHIHNNTCLVKKTNNIDRLCKFITNWILFYGDVINEDEQWMIEMVLHRDGNRRHHICNM